ncbi:Gfo/Idh/MocA family protein [Pelagibius sp.]|uniref:Gfo/Idh/MocA family protein n=1 Tax=Pelagibius sp. TaxID=1931238 RepID=UPI002622D127|nr:Gfo/Idh/MocA family oxidoreductase [Pelagibius sp.]
MSDLRWGVLSTARIGTEKVIPGIQRSRRGRVTAIASRDLGRAEAAAADLKIDKAYGSYEELLADPDIDAVYNPLPNNLHVDLTLQAAAAGKAVLCEKPVAMTKADAERLRAVEGKVPVMEAFMVRFHPQWLWARDQVRAGRLGELRAIQAFFSYFNRDPANIRNAPETGGGALLDIGCYPMVAGRFFFEGEPQRVLALIERDPDFQVDRLTSALLDFGGGRRVDFTVSTQVVPYQRVQLIGTDGRLEIEIPFNAPQGEATRLFLDDGSDLRGGGIQVQDMEAVDQYAEQADVFAAAVLGEAPLPYGIKDAVQNMAILDALFRSDESGQWESVG